MRWVLISTHLPPPVMTESTTVRAATTHMLCCSCGICFSAAASSENDQGSMNLASKTAPLASARPSSGHPAQPKVPDMGLDLLICPVLALYQRRLSYSVTVPLCSSFRQRLGPASGEL